jgi:hypothetical protein
MNIILQFNFEIGDTSCKYYQVYVVVACSDYPDFETIEDSISSYFESTISDTDLDYEDYVEDIMRESGLTWEFVGEIIPEAKTIYSFWI